MKKKKLLFTAAAAVLYGLLVLLMSRVERASPDASIRSFPLALWFSLTTLTTVGYGDLYPVTAAGRIIAAVFEIMSIGVLAMLIGAVVAAIRARLLPLIRLRLMRNKPWFVFPMQTEAALTLAAALHAEDPDRVIVFCGEGAGKPPFSVQITMEPAELSKRKKSGKDLSVFCMFERDAENERLARALEGVDCSVYCMSVYEPDRLPDRQHRFDPYDCCARLYWRRFPVASAHERIVMIGSGKYAEAILEQALQRNVVSDVQALTYEVFGDYDRFRLNHPYLSQICRIDAQAEDGDSLFFRDGPWNAFPESLQAADRIIFCCETKEKTIEALTELKRFFPVTAALHARLSAAFDGVTSFGSMEEIFTPELVMRARLDRTAMELNEIYRATTGGGAPAWNELSSFLRRSNIASAEHLAVKAQILLGDDGTAELTAERAGRAYAVYSAADEAQWMRYLRIEHVRWVRFHILNNWQYAPERDNSRRLHPLIVPFDSLSPEEKRKDAYGWKLLETLQEDSSR